MLEGTLVLLEEDDWDVIQETKKEINCCVEEQELAAVVVKEEESRSALKSALPNSIV